MSDKFYLGQSVLVMSAHIWMTGYVDWIDGDDLVLHIYGGLTVRHKKSKCVGLPETEYMMSIQQAYDWWRFGK